MASGLSKAMIQARLISALLQKVSDYDLDDEIKDKIWTLAVYFNSIKELGKSSTLIDDDVKDFIRRLHYRNIFKLKAKRSFINVKELTSRVGTTELNDTLDTLSSLVYSRENMENHKYPVDVLLATNMISVGIDISRLNLMILVGQPLTTSEYIQASSRIGRSHPGLAITLFDGSKSRDRSHYEQFNAYHQAFYKYVEPTSVTPFSEPALDRALHSIVISMLRHKVELLNLDSGAASINDLKLKEVKDEVTNFIVNRVKEINSYDPSGMKDNSECVRRKIDEIIKIWESKAKKSSDLIFGDKHIMGNGEIRNPRLIKSFNDLNRDDGFKTLTSMRNVETNIPISILIWEDEKYYDK